MWRTPAQRPRRAICVSSVVSTTPAFEAAGDCPPIFLSGIRARAARLLALGPLAALAKLRARLWSQRELRVYRGDRALAPRLELDHRVQCNRVYDLERMQPTETWQ